MTRDVVDRDATLRDRPAAAPSPGDQAGVREQVDHRGAPRADAALGSSSTAAAERRAVELGQLPPAEQRPARRDHLVGRRPPCTRVVTSSASARWASRAAGRSATACSSSAICSRVRKVKILR